MTRVLGVRFEDVTKVFDGGTVALDHLDLAVDAGELVGAGEERQHRDLQSFLEAHRLAVDVVLEADPAPLVVLSPVAQPAQEDQDPGQDVDLLLLLRMGGGGAPQPGEVDEEHQPGEMFHDPDLYDAGSDGIDSFGEFRRNLRSAGVEDRVVPIVAGSTETARDWRTPLGMVFIDGGHSLDTALEDYRCWAMHIVRGGILAIHDVYPDPHAGGQAPWAVLQMARSSGLFKELERVGSLGVLRRL